jgi:hypothetical protein
VATLSATTEWVVRARLWVSARHDEPLEPVRSFLCVEKEEAGDHTARACEGGRGGEVVLS